jgi:penicillin-binding protein 1A
MVMDEQMDLRKLQVGGLEGVVGEWGMEVINPGYEKLITSRRALEVSKIAATVELGQDVGLSKVLQTTGFFGFDLTSDNLLNRMLVGFDKVSMSEVVSAYSTFPRGGTRITAKHYIREIRDIEGKVVYPTGEERAPPVAKAVCSEAAAFQVHSILNEVMKTGNLAEKAKGLKQDLLLGGGKSGTPYGFSDAWMVGYNSRITSAVWVGFYEGGRKAIHGKAFAKNVAYPVWERIMNSSQPSFSGKEILPPNTIEKVSVCRVSGMRPTRYCNEAVEDLVTGALSFRSTSYQEYLGKGRELGICTEHGGGIDIDNLAERSQPQEAINAIPIKAKAPLLLGFDPYNSKTPTLGIKDQDAEAWLSFDDVLVVEDYVRGEREALLNLSRPPRFMLPSPPEPEESPE